MGVGPGPAGAGSLQKDSKVAAAKGQAVRASRKQVTMKGLYFQQSSTNEKITFVFQERENLPVAEDNYVKLQVKACALSHINTKLLAEMKMEKDFFPVGREIAGIVLDVGSKVSFFQPDDEVVGILPLDSEDPGLCEVVRVHEHYLVHKPEKVSWTEAAGTVRDGVRAYTALHYLSRLAPGKWVLIMDGASALGTIAIQLAHHRGARVISTACSPEDKQYLEGLRPALVRLYSKDDEPAAELQLLPHKHDILTLLGVGGHWVTTEENLQLDPPDSHCLFLKGATVAFLNDEVWNLSNVQQGKYLCVLKDVMEKLATGVLGLVWMSLSRLMRPKSPWKGSRKIKEEKSKLFSFNFVISQISVE
ncbi:quinone oxidoreductase-like protein 1 isoform X4 [Myotis lucifugus]|uniref:quinone oxidoreductase-like protein 1 isoform X4 n=1 Tax=Myotis lucifugus TaxID=59463 RepID=UPI000CCC7703|nr:quinone oxidoreductase-like protein 1 isoform X4 [Myotis lucifugus]